MKTKYRIHTTTSDFPDAGFNSNVYVQIFGSIKTRRSSSPSSKNKSTKSSSKLVSFRFPLQISKNNAQKFRPGQTDLFEFEEETEIDKIKKIRLTHDSRNSRWHLKKLVVELVDEDEEGRKKEASVNRKWTFDCSQWIDGSDSGVELSPSKLKNDATMSNTEETDDEFDSDSSYFSDDESRAKRKEKKKKEKENEKEKNKGKDMAKVRYKIKIVTNAISKIEPGMKIKIKLVGVNGETGWIRVEEFPAIHIFKAEENDVGMIDRLIISSQNKENGKPIDWYYDEIVVSVHKFKTFIFNSKGRSIIDIDKEKNRLLNEIFPTEIQDISKKINYTVSFYSRTRPLVSNEILVKLYGEFGNSGEFKTKLVKSEQKSKKLFAKNILVNFSQKFFDFGKVYKIDLGLIEPKNVKKDLECLTRSFIVLTHGKQQYNLFYIKNKSIKKDKDDKGNDDESDDTNAVKIVFYEQEYMKKQFADELVHDMLFDEPKRRRKSRSSKDDKKHDRRRSDGSSGSTNRSSQSLQRRKHEYDDYSSFESDRDSRDRRYSPRRQNRSTGSIERYSPRSKPKSSESIDRYSPRRQRDRSPSIDRYSPRPKTKSTGSIDRYSPQRRKDRSPSIDRYSPRSKSKSSGSVDRYSPRRQRDRSPSIDRYSPRRADTRDSYKSKPTYDDYIAMPSKTKPKPNKYDFDEPDYKYNDNIRKSNYNKKLDFDERDYNYNDYNRKSNYNKKYDIDEIDYFGRKDDDYGYKRNKDKDVFDSRKIRYNEPPKSSVRPSVKINLDAY